MPVREGQFLRLEDHAMGLISTLFSRRHKSSWAKARCKELVRWVKGGGVGVVLSPDIRTALFQQVRPDDSYLRVQRYKRPTAGNSAFGG